MKSIFSILMALFSFSAFAQDNIALKSVNSTLVHNQGQISSLAAEFSEDQFLWSPSEGVRSVGASLLHVASANYFFAMKLGFPPSSDVDMMGINSIEGKANIVEVVKNSNKFVQNCILKIDPSTLSEKVELPFGEMDKMSLVLLILEHSGEHKGQLIAYARSNGITPPWSK